MELTKIVIKNYKAIKSPVEISFNKDMPTVLIGKNGCGKTTILEALYKIAEANRIRAYGREKGDLLYNARIQLSEEDVKAVLPLLKYDPSQCEIVAYGGNQYLQMDRIESSYIVPSFKKEIADIGELADQLAQAVNIYEKQVGKLACDGDAESTLQSCVLKHEDGRLTNFRSIQCEAERFLKDIRQFLQEVQTNFVDEKNEYVYGSESFSIRDYSHQPPKPFQLEYREPTLAAFVQKHVTINKNAIKREITRINKETKESCNRINELINEINERTMRIHDGLRKEDD
jgi:energy-coupling factor transporter ATP-binding protein EcfA2